MKKRLLVIGILILVALVSACTTKLGPKIELSKTYFDLGDINPDNGIRTETFYVKNTGDSILTISSISTSCGCTEAEVKSNKILPGEQTELTVNYDPSVHSGLVGKIKRVVYIKSNDPLNEELELELVGNSLPSSNQDGNIKPTEHDEEYEGLLKEFEISPPALYKKISSGDSFKLLDVREDFEYEEGHLKDSLLLSVNKMNQIELDKLGLKKDDEIVLYCHSGKRSARAYEILKALGYTNVKSLYGGIVHWSEDEYPIEEGNTEIIKTQDNYNEESASISFDKTEYDFGKIAQLSGIVNTTFQITNKGPSDLKITSISTSCGCTTAKLEELIIPPGKSSILTVFFDPNLHEEPEGRFSRTVFLETNDPTNPETEVKIWIDILEDQ